MKLFSEKVKKTSTNSNHNILQVENFSEIFFNVFEIEINKSKYPVEKISEYDGNPVVSVPVLVEGIEIFYPFILIQGKFELLFNENNTLDNVFPNQNFESTREVPVIVEENSGILVDDDTFEYLGEDIADNKKNILAQIEKAKKTASDAIKRDKAFKLQQISEAGDKQNSILQDTLQEARENLVGEFITISDKLRKELIEESKLEYSELKETLDNKLVDICEDLDTQLRENFTNASEIFDSKITTLVKELYSQTVHPKLEKELNDIAFQIVEKVGDIETTLDKKLDTKADKTLVEGVSKELSAIQKANIELNDSINKGINKALSRSGNVKTLVEKIDKEINEKISTKLSNIENYFDERIQNIQEQTFDITEESRKYIIDLVNKSKVELLEEIRKIPVEKPVEYIIESNKKDPEKVNLDKLKKEYDTIIHNKFENYKTDLRKYISVYSGGGSVAMQFADGGVMNGNLVVVGSISASQYLGITGGGASTDTLDDVTSRGNVTNNTISVSGVDAKYIQFDTNNIPLENAEGLLQWNSTDGTLDLGMDGGDITMQLGQEMFTKVRNQTGTTIPNGMVVYFSGRSGNRPLIELARSDNDTTSRVAGITTQDISSPSDGFITTVGYVRRIKTDYVGSGVWGNTWNEGDILYVSKTNAGVVTNIEPSSPHHSDIVGSVGIVHSSLGSILISLERHRTLENLSDVNGTPLTRTGQIPVWNNSAGYFDFDYNFVDSLSTKANLSGGNTFSGNQNFTNSISALSASITGNLTVDTNTLFVDSVNNRVGIGTATPNSTLDINGTLTVAGNTTLVGTTVATGKIIANGQGALSALGDNDVLTKKAFVDWPFLSPYQPIYHLPLNAGWGSATAGVGSGVIQSPDTLNMRVGQVAGAYAFTTLGLMLAKLANFTVTGYSRIDWSGRLFLDIVCLPAYGLTTSPGNQYRGIRNLHAIAAGFRSDNGSNANGPNALISPIAGVNGTASGVGILTYTPDDTSMQIRLAKPPVNINASVITNASNTSPIVITTTGNHSLSDGDNVEVRGVQGNTAANGFWIITNASGSTFTLVGSTTSGAYTTGGGLQVVSPVLATITLSLTRFVIEVFNGVATLYLNDSPIGSMSGFYTGNGGYGSIINHSTNTGPVGGLLGGANTYIKRISVGAIF